MDRKTEGIIVIAIAIAAFAVMMFTMGLDTPMLLFIADVVALAIGISIIVDGNKAAVNTKSGHSHDEVVDSKTLHEEMNRDLKKDGKSSLPPINTIGGVSTNNLARRDHSWSSVPDFFVKLAKKDK